MSDYLQQLERLGQLLTAGILTDEEFKAEKARILEQQASSARQGKRGKSWWQSQRMVLGGGAILVAVLGGALGLSSLPAAHKGDDATAEIKVAEKSGPVAAQGPGDAKLGLANPSDCEPNQALANLLRRLKEAGASTNSKDKVIEVGASNELIDVQSAVLKAGTTDVTIAEAGVPHALLGLRLKAVSTLSWDEGEGFRLTFSEPIESAKQAMSVAGLKLEHGRKQSLSAGQFALLSEHSSSSSLTCMKAHTSKPNAANKTSVEENSDA